MGRVQLASSCQRVVGLYAARRTTHRIINSMEMQPGGTAAALAMLHATWQCEAGPTDTSAGMELPPCVSCRHPAADRQAPRAPWSGRAPLVLNWDQLPPQMTTVTVVYGGYMGMMKLAPEPGYVTGVPPSAKRGSRKPGPLVIELLAVYGLLADSRATYHRLPGAKRRAQGCQPLRLPD